MAVDLGKQPTVDADQKAIQQINFTRNLTLNPVANTTVFFIIEEAQETILNFLQGAVKVLWMCSTIYFALIMQI